MITRPIHHYNSLMPNKFLRPTVFSGGLSEKLKYLGEVNNWLSQNSIAKGNVNSYYVQ